MNCTVYLFGEFGLGYTQYPQDGAEDIFRHMSFHAEAQTQIAIHRDGNLMYYAYLRRLDEGEGHYIGYGLMVDGLMFRDISPLFDLFGSTFENMVIADRLLTLNARGHIVANVGLLLEKRPEVERVINNLCTSISEFSTQFIPLPKVVFDHLSTQIWKFGEDADPSDIRQASQMSGYTIVQKGRLQVAIDSPFVVNPEKKETNSDNHAVAVVPKPAEKTNVDEERKSEPTPQVKPEKPSPKRRWDGMKTFLLILLILSLGGLAYTITLLQSANEKESSAQSSYNKAKMTNAELGNRISDLESQLEETKLKSEEMEKRLLRQDSVITALRSYYKCNQPFLATSIYVTREGEDGYSSATIGNRVRSSRDLKLQPHVRYVGLEKTRSRLTLRWYSPRNIGFFDFGDISFGSRSHDDNQTFDIETGEHVLDFSVWSGDSRDNWESGKYTLELWAGSECLQRKEFWVD